MEPPLTPLTKSKHVDKSDKAYIKLKLRRDPMSSSSDLYEFKIDFFGNGDPEDSVLFL